MTEHVLRHTHTHTPRVTSSGGMHFLSSILGRDSNALECVLNKERELENLNDTGRGNLGGKKGAGSGPFAICAKIFTSC